jgi:hypothetical protein
MSLVRELLEADDPSIRYKTRVHVLGESARSKKARALRDEIAKSPRASALLSERKRNGQIPHPPYSKWRGTHWVLYALAELEYPPGDESLLPLREQELAFMLSKEYEGWIRHVKGITRIHASIDANAIWSLHRLGLADERVDKLVARLVETQWRDGGWNCDVRATGNTSSFHESLLPLRALTLHARETGDRVAREAAERCAEIFLKRKLYKRERDGKVMDSRFLQLHFPRYWHYDVLGGLIAMRDAERLDDPRSADALDWLEARQLPRGGWRADATFYRHTRREVPTGSSYCDWGRTGTTTRNEFVTVEALTVLRAAKRHVERE